MTIENVTKPPLIFDYDHDIYFQPLAFATLSSHSLSTNGTPLTRTFPTTREIQKSMPGDIFFCFFLEEVLTLDFSRGLKVRY